MVFPRVELGNVLDRILNSIFWFPLKKFIELLRKGTHEAAIGCLRTCVAPCALDAYPVLEYSIPFYYSLSFFVTSLYIFLLSLCIAFTSKFIVINAYI